MQPSSSWLSHSIKTFLLAGTFAWLAVPARCQDATLILDNPHKSVARPAFGTIDVPYTGTLIVSKSFNGAYPDVFFPFRHGGYSHRLEYTNAPQLIAFLSDLNVQTNGGTYHGPIFNLQVPSNVPSGYYDHSGYSATIDPIVFLRFSGATTFETNRQDFTIAVDGPEKQVEVQLDDPYWPDYWYLYPFTASLYQGANHLEDVPVYPNGDGSFLLDMVLPSGQVDIRVQTGHWLAKRQSVTIQNGYSFGNVMNLTSGDIDHDNVVSVFDYIVLSDYFDMSWEDENWGEIGSNGFAPYEADMDGDGVVSVFDYIIISDSFDMSGDESS